MTRIGAAEAKRRFSELLDRVAGGERIVVERHGRPAVVLVRLHDESSAARPAQAGFAPLAGALADLPTLAEVLRDTAAARAGATDRPGPDLG